MTLLRAAVRYRYATGLRPAMRVWGTLIVAYVISVGMSVPIPFARWGRDWMHSLWTSRALLAGGVALLLLLAPAALLRRALTDTGPHLALLPLTRRQRFAIDSATLALFYIPPFLGMLAMTLAGREALPFGLTLRNEAAIVVLTCALPPLATMLARRGNASGQVTTFLAFAGAVACAFAPSLPYMAIAIALVTMSIHAAARATMSAPPQERFVRIESRDDDELFEVLRDTESQQQHALPPLAGADRSRSQPGHTKSRHRELQLRPTQRTYALLRNEWRWLGRFGAVVSSSALVGAILVGGAQLAIHNNEVARPLTRARVASLFGAIAAATAAGNVATARRLARPYRAFEATLPIRTGSALLVFLAAASPIVAPTLVTFALLARDRIVLLLAIPYTIATFIAIVLLAERVALSGARDTNGATLAAGCAFALAGALEPRMALLAALLLVPLAFRLAVDAHTRFDMPSVPAEVTP